jgi:choline dehydrogenase-like flavoprotein
VAAGEVILCGGAVNSSPQLLMLSGIGPQQHLAEFGISSVHHLPGVGQSLQDHYSAPIKLKCKLPITVNDVMLSNVRKLKAGLEASNKLSPRRQRAAHQMLGRYTRPDRDLDPRQHAQDPHRRSRSASLSRISHSGDELITRHLRGEDIRAGDAAAPFASWETRR